MIRIYIISKHALFTYGLESLLNQESDLEIVGQAKDFKHSLAQIRVQQPDVIILDSDRTLPENATEIIESLHDKWEVRVISLNLNNNDLYVHRATRQPVRDVNDLIQAIKHSAGVDSLVL